MVIKILSDGNVLLSLGFLFLLTSYALEQYAGTGATIDFIRGLLIGLSAAASLVAVVIFVTGQDANKK